MAGERHSSSCYLDERTFRHCCQVFLQHSVTIQDGWSWEEIKGADEGFMRKTVLIPVRSDTSHHHDVCSVQTENTESLTEELQADVEDEAAGVQAVCESPVVLRYEYHVVYSSSYQIPVLYFRVSTLDGRSVSLEEVWSNVHPNYRQRLRQEPWDTLTQQEHPLLGQPFFMLHPCRTEEFMKPALDLAQSQHKRLNYIVTWLSVVGPVVGLDVPLSYITAVSAPD
ncbi:ubiquitin-like-conjugating enzyme ATG10 [Triplophysa dalaica]|uniref:ubiquitin-like-conjugating enzyme ATG10 n=1 Tax=Triplophysa dalaica TaxID=1582913 RepID=UPI0024DF9FA4|nr:ubiquitin-like-conjugating enzyme ATG10 [Triplophysa dalaica]XP_056592307.1 ubiquitin-like-conjugating enzyme ATG10 [Triplophysa dalaica]XP_056592308.1 ubiquitin-like-conjugating enzyme ATG10 [Triplophysa dalaica]